MTEEKRREILDYYVDGQWESLKNYLDIVAFQLKDYGERLQTEAFREMAVIDAADFLRYAASNIEARRDAIRALEAEKL